MRSPIVLFAAMTIFAAPALCWASVAPQAMASITGPRPAPHPVPAPIPTHTPSDKKPVSPPKPPAPKPPGPP